MAADEIRLWVMDGSGGATPLELEYRTESEKLLEDTLVRHPDILMPGLTIVGRQIRTEGGPLDLLGVDRDGRLSLFELKRGALNRDAVAQVVDYGSWLESMGEAELSQHISRHSGSGGVEKIDDFEGWYSENRGGQELSGLRPIRLFLIGLGVDETTNRMVRFLADGGIDISLVTFLGFNHAGQTLLARQVQVEAAAEPERAAPRRRLGRRLGMQARWERFSVRLQEITSQRPEAQELWDAVQEMFRENFPGVYLIPSGAASDWAKGRLHLRTPGRNENFAGLQLPQAPVSELVSVIFYRNAVNSCLPEFVQLRRDLPYWTYPFSRSAVEARDVEVAFPLNSLSEWESCKERLAAVTRSVYEAFNPGYDADDDSEDEE